jgi:tetratricopeptide (TPR) repeat protein
LARHFQAAGILDKAVTYLHQAGDRAMRLCANAEAISHLTQGLALLETLPETPERVQQELAMQLALVAPLQATRGYAAPETGRAYARARELSLHAYAGETPQLVQALGLLGSYYGMKAEYPTSLELYEQALGVAERLQDPLLVAMGHLGVGFTLAQSGEFAPALSHLEHVIDFYDPQQHRPLAFVVGQDVGASAQAWMAWAQWFLGYADRALKHSQEAIALAQASDHPFTLCFTRSIAGSIFYLLRREDQAAREQAEMITLLAAEGGFALYQAAGKILLGWVQAEEGLVEEGLAQMRQGLAAWLATGTESFRSYYIALLAEVHGKAGQTEEGLRLLAEALEAARHSGERFWEAELYRLKGEFLARDEAVDEAEVEVCFQHALQAARRKSARSLELRAAMSLSRLWQRQGKREKARQLLAETYGWFTEGFDTPDLQEAKTLLEALSDN